MILLIATAVIILATGWAQYRNGLFSSFAMRFGTRYSPSER